MNKKFSETTFVGTYRDAGDDDFNPQMVEVIENKNKVTGLAGHIAKELSSFDGKNVKLTVTITAEEI